jgi:hypothetical protein
MTVVKPRFAGQPDVLERRVLFALELVDPITGARVTEGLDVGVADVAGKPILNHSGRLVWLVEGTAWPGAITVTPTTAPYAPHVQAPPPRPADVLTATAAQRLVRIVLRPTVAYTFDTGVTAVRGSLREQIGVPSRPVAGARVQLAWFDVFSNTWRPPPPEPNDVCPETDANGEFAAFLRLARTPPADPDLERGLLKARLQVTRGSDTRVTPDDFPFLPAPVERGRVPEGRLLPRDIPLGWADLVGI